MTNMMLIDSITFTEDEAANLVAVLEWAIEGDIGYGHTLTDEAVRVRQRALGKVERMLAQAHKRRAFRATSMITFGQELGGSSGWASSRFPNTINATPLARAIQHVSAHLAFAISWIETEPVVDDANVSELAHARQGTLYDGAVRKKESHLGRSDHFRQTKKYALLHSSGSIPRTSCPCRACVHSVSTSSACNRNHCLTRRCAVFGNQPAKISPSSATCAESPL